jgi:hypothetical protein
MRNEHFLEVADWRAAAPELTFQPVAPRYTAGRTLQSLTIHIRDRKRRELPKSDRTLEAHYGAFVLSEAQNKDARRKALETSYGPDPRDVRVAGHDGQSYDLGPEVPLDDPDGRMPAVVVWSDGDMFYLIASGELTPDVLLRIAQSLYA